MFEAHNTLIRETSKRSVKTFFLSGVFAICTANAPLMASVHATRFIARNMDRLSELSYADITQGERSLMGVALNGAKLSYIQSLYIQREKLHALCYSVDHLTFWNYLLDNVSGLGLVKAAFFTQLVKGEMCCLDIHNMRALGQDKVLTGKSKTARKKYYELQSQFESSEIWDSWCNFVAEKYPKLFKDGFQVSAWHIHAILGVEMYE